MKIELTVKELHELLSETIEDITTNKLTAFIERHNTPNLYPEYSVDNKTINDLQTAQPTSRLSVETFSEEKEGRTFSVPPLWRRKPTILKKDRKKRKQTAAAKALISKKLKAAWRRRKAQARLKRFIRRINKKTKPPLPKSKVR